MNAPALGTLRGTVLRGLAWNAGYQVFASMVQFGAMLVVVRIIPPAEYGHWAVALGILQFLNAVNIASFLSHALQLQAGHEPNWTLHWHVGNIIQAVLFVACNGIGFVLRRWPGYAAVSVLLHIASVGLLFNTAAQMRMVMLQRQLDYRRIRTITALSSLLGAGSIILGAAAGYGARALVLGGNVLVSVPFIVDLLVVDRWRPEGRWFAWPEFPRYRDSLVFGATRIATGLLSASRGALNAALLPSTLGFEAIGLMNRAEGLYAMSVGRGMGLLSETVYPILPQIAGDEQRFARIGRAYSLLMLSLVLAAVGLFAACGSDLSRLLYGSKWTAADPLLLPGAVIGLGGGLATVGSQILLAKGQLKHVFALNILPPLVLCPAFIGVMILGWNVVIFFWTVALSLVLTGVISLHWAARWLPGGSLSTRLAGPAMAAAFGTLFAFLVGRAAGNAGRGLRTAVTVVVFSLVWLAVLRSLFPAMLAEMLDLVPGGARMRKIARLNDARSWLRGTRTRQ